VRDGTGGVDVPHERRLAGETGVRQLDVDVVGADVGDAPAALVEGIGGGEARGGQREPVHVAEKFVNEGRGRVVVHGLRGAGLLDTRLVHDHDLVGDFERLLLVVGDEDGGEVHFLVELAQPAAQVLAHAGIECAEGFVEQQDFGFDGEGTGECHALALAAGELRGQAAFVAVELHEPEQVVNAFANLGFGGPRGAWADGQAEGDVVEDGEVAEERVVLEDESDSARADGRLADVLPVETDGAGAWVGHFQSGDDAQERGLAGAGGAEQRGEAAARDGEADIVERGVLAERFAEMGDFDTHEEDSEAVRRARHSTMLFRTRVSSARSARRDATAKAATKLYSL